MSTKDVDMTSSERHGFVADDSFLWNSFRQGNTEAFEVIYKRYSNSMYNYGMHLFMDKTLVEDSIQDVFVEIWNRKQFLSETTSIKFYLLKALKHKALRKLLTENKYELQFLVDGFPLQLEDSAETKLIVEQSTSHVSEMVKQAVQELPERQREIIEQRFYRNLSPNEISSSMKLSIDSTYTLLSRAIRELRKNLKKMKKD
jgi:RNA polymerase sigma factor (sigma-70 family)